MSTKTILNAIIGTIALVCAAVFADYYLPWLLFSAGSVIFFARTIAQHLIDQKASGND